MLKLFKNSILFFNNNSYIKGIFINKLELNLVITSNNLYNILLILKKKTQYQLSQLIDIFVYDNPENLNRFSISYSLLSINYNFRLCIKFSASTLSSLFSITSLYPSANWLEREVFDMFGIYFLFNSNLCRILTDYGFNGHPLRKDFPLIGYLEVFYNDLVKSIIFTKVSLSQDYRSFFFKSLQLC